MGFFVPGDLSSHALLHSNIGPITSASSYVLPSVQKSIEVYISPNGYVNYVTGAVHVQYSLCSQRPTLTFSGTTCMAMVCLNPLIPMDACAFSAHSIYWTMLRGFWTRSCCLLCVAHHSTRYVCLTAEKEGSGETAPP